MSDLPTYKKALQAMKEAEKVGIVVTAIKVRGREFELVLGSTESKDDYDLRPMKL